MSDPALASNASEGSARAADAARPSSGDAPRAGGGDVLAAAMTSGASDVLATSGASDVIATSGASDVIALRPAAATTSDADKKPTLRDLKRREIALKQSQRDEYAKMAAKLSALGATDAHATTLAKVKGLDAELARLRASAPPPKPSTAADKTSKTWRRGSRALDGVAGEEVTVGGGAEGGSILKKYSATAAAASKAPEERGEGFIVGFQCGDLLAGAGRGVCRAVEATRPRGARGTHAPRGFERASDSERFAMSFSNPTPCATQAAPAIDAITSSSAAAASPAAAPRSAAAILRKYSSSSAARSVAQPKTTTKPTFVTSRPRRPSDEAGEAAEDMLPLAKRAKNGG